MYRVFFGHSLAHLVHRPPVAVIISQFVRRKHSLSCLQKRIHRIRGFDGGAVLVGIGVEKLHVKADEPVLAWKKHHIAMSHRSNDAILADVGKIGLRNDIQNPCTRSVSLLHPFETLAGHLTPERICLIPIKGNGKSLPHPAVRPVAGHNVLCAHSFPDTSRWI